MHALTLALLPETFAICRLDPSAHIPPWAVSGGFVSITRTRDELSVVCPRDDVPTGVFCQPAWRCLRVEGPLDFSLVGILMSLAAPLASAGISIFAISTYETDYVLVQAERATEAIQVLLEAGHQVLSSA